MHLDLECAESFVALVEELHYGRAAARLHMTSSSLTKRVQRLERQVQAPLLLRGPEGVLALTPAGARLLRDVGPLLAHEASVRDAALHPRTTVVLGVPDDGRTGPAFADEAAALERLVRQDDPGARVAVRRTPLPLLAAWLLDGRVDVQLTAGPVQHSGVRSSPFTTSQRVVALPARDRRWDGVPQLLLEQVVELPLLHDPGLAEDFMHPFWLGDLRAAADAHLVAIVARESSTVLEHVVRGAGATVLLAAQQDAVPPGVRVVPLVGAPPLVLHAAVRSQDRRTAVRSLLGALLVVPPVTC